MSSVRRTKLKLTSYLILPGADSYSSMSSITPQFIHLTATRVIGYFDEMSIEIAVCVLLVTDPLDDGLLPPSLHPPALLFNKDGCLVQAESDQVGAEEGFLDKKAYNLSFCNSNPNLYLLCWSWSAISPFGSSKSRTVLSVSVIKHKSNFRILAPCTS